MPQKKTALASEAQRRLDLFDAGQAVGSAKALIESTGRAQGLSESEIQANLANYDDPKVGFIPSDPKATKTRWQQIRWTARRAMAAECEQETQERLKLSEPAWERIKARILARRTK